jgi:hypothetical protein
MKRIPVALWFLGVALPASAATPYGVEGAGAIATGGAAVANADDNTALSVNPAVIGLSDRYAVDLIGGFFDGRDVRFGGSAVDATTTQGLALGVAYQRSYLSIPLTVDELPGWGAVGAEPATARRFDTLTLGVSIPVIEDRLAFGAGGTAVFISHPVLEAPITGNLTVGAAGRPAERWTVALAGRNLLPVFFPTDPRASVALGNRYAWNEHTALSLDLELPLDLAGDVPVIGRFGASWGDDLRAFGVGYRWVGPSSEHWVTAGFSIFSQAASDPRVDRSRGGLRYATEVPLHPLTTGKGRLLAIRHTLTVTIEPDLRARGRSDRR